MNTSSENEISRLHQQADTLLKNGRSIEARALYDKICSLDEKNAHAWLRMASIDGESGNVNQAVVHIRKSIMIDPDNPDAWKLLLIACTQSGETDAWIDFCKQVTAQYSVNGMAWLGQGYALEHTGAREQALKCYQRATDLDPQLHEAWTRRATVCAVLERYNESLELFRMALAAGSSTPLTHCGYGSMLRQKGLFEESEKHCRIALKKAPNWSAALLELGLVLTDQGHLGEAVGIFQQVLYLEPYNKDSAAALAEVYERMAEPELAYAVIKPFLGAGDTNSQIACMFAKLSVGLDKREEALIIIDNTLRDTTLTVQQQVDLNFRAAEIFNGQKKYDDAIGRYNQANALKPVTFNALQRTGLIDGMMSLFTRETIAGLSRVTLTSDRPVFVVGMPRSGTSLVEQILACHKRVHGAGELMEIGDYASELGFRLGKPVPTVNQIEPLSQDKLDKLSQRYLKKLESLSSAEDRVTDKMPGNYLWLGVIQLLFPEARIIHIRRDPLDTCLSCYFSDFNGTHEYAYNLEDLGHYYCGYLRLMEHWRHVISVPILDISYEDLVADTEKVSRTMLEFCGLEWDPEVLNFHESGRLVSTASYLQVKKPIYTSSVGRWKHYSKHLEPLQEALASGQFTG